MRRLAFLGLGAMGAPMAERLLAAGHELAVWNRSRSRTAPFEGRARIASTPADALAGVEAAITMVSTPEALDEVLFGPDGAVEGAASGTTFIDMSTVGPDAVLEVASRLREGLDIVDAPVLGSVSNAGDGSLRVFVGATPKAFERWRGVLAAMGEPVRLGPTGAGAAMKLVANSTLAGLMCLIGEALRLADELGLERERAIGVLLDSRIGPAMKPKLDKIRSGRYDASFRLDLMRKDLDLILAAAERRDVGLRLAEAARRWFEDAEAEALGSLDYSAVVARIAGTAASG